MPLLPFIVGMATGAAGFYAVSDATRRTLSLGAIFGVAYLAYRYAR